MGKDLAVLWEDESVLVIDKIAGMSVTPSKTEKGVTVQDYLMNYFDLFDLGIGQRAGIVHRLDKETSGCLLVAKSQDSFLNLTKQFQEREVLKTYLTLVHGEVKEETLTASVPLARHPKKRRKFAVLPFGRVSETRFKLQKSYEFQRGDFNNLLAVFPRNKKRFFEKNAHLYSLLEAYPRTGRTHQIRLHIKFLGHPIVCDPLYSGKFYPFDKLFCPRMFLHAQSITFDHPKTGKQMTFKSVLPEDLRKTLNFLQETN